MKINLVLADDHRLFRDVLTDFLHRTPDIRVIGQASSGDELLELMKAMTPDLILLDLDMPGQSALSYAERLSATHPLVPVLAFSMHGAEECEERAKPLRNVWGCLAKQIDSAYFLNIVRSVAFTRKTREATSDQQLRPPRRSGAPVERLTRQEAAVLKLMLAQLSNEEIAARLFKSTRTIEGHRTNIYHKTGARTLVGVVQYALEYGVVTQAELKELVHRAP